MILLSQPKKGDIMAFSSVCTHQGCTVKPDGAELHCPCHNSIYDSATGAINFSDALAKVQDSLDSADQLSQQLATGQLTDVHDFTVAANKAQLAVQLTVQLRNQALGAFQEIMRMQI